MYQYKQEVDKAKTVKAEMMEKYHKEGGKTKTTNDIERPPNSLQKHINAF